MEILKILHSQSNMTISPKKCRPKNCRICGKTVPLKKGRTRTQVAGICRGTVLPDGTRLPSECQKTYLSEWHREHYAKLKRTGVKKTKPDRDVRNICLKCGKEFMALSKNNRICGKCTWENDFINVRTATLHYGRKGR